MTHRYKSEPFVISLDGDLSSETLALRKKYRHLFIYSAKDLYAAKQQIGSGQCVKYLDSFLLVLPHNYAFQSILWEDFYSYYGDSFEEMIDTEHNIQCIKHIYNYLQKQMPVTRRTRILDFGCGSGLAMCLSSECDLIGYEPNEKMRRQALQKGMRVMDMRQLGLIPEHSVDAVFSSYVFHMGIQAGDIDILNRILRPNGIMIANYYKGINCRTVNKLCRQRGFIVKRVRGLEKKFGSIYEYQKRD